jgi:hypothetical protein
MSTRKMSVEEDGTRAIVDAQNVQLSQGQKNDILIETESQVISLADLFAPFMNNIQGVNVKITLEFQPKETDKKK